ncbi:MAG TPA: hypothetical protein VH722_20360 [Alphaproteobacteria bacterium]|jgi:hypothetical protein|nr:hypothetical protein [Alphaproteobacteria bacterium]
MGDELKWSRLPFDWTITPLANAVGWLKGPLRFPQSADALVPVETWPGGYEWSGHGVYFGHDFGTPEGLDVAGTFEETRSTYLRHFHKLRKLGELDQVVAIVSNTQNNLSEVLPEADVLFRRHDMARLKAVFERLIGRSCRMLCVTYDDRSVAGFTSMPERDITVKQIARDASETHGSNEAWEKVFADYFAKAD